MHAILVLPLLAWLLSFANWAERRRLGVVQLGALGYLLLAGVVAVENVSGLAFWETPLALVVISGFGVLALLSAGLLALSGLARSFSADGLTHD
jgi:hypothetical protein